MDTRHTAQPKPKPPTRSEIAQDAIDNVDATLKQLKADFYERKKKREKRERDKKRRGKAK